MESEGCAGVAPENLRLPRAIPSCSVAWRAHEIPENFGMDPSSLGLPFLLEVERCFGGERKGAVDLTVDEIGHQNLAMVPLHSAHPLVHA